VGYLTVLKKADVRHLNFLKLEFLTVRGPVCVIMPNFLMTGEQLLRYGNLLTVFQNGIFCHLEFVVCAEYLVFPSYHSA